MNTQVIHCLSNDVFLNSKLWLFTNSSLSDLPLPYFYTRVQILSTTTYLFPLASQVTSRFLSAGVGWRSLRIATARRTLQEQNGHYQSGGCFNLLDFLLNWIALPATPKRTHGGVSSIFSLEWRVYLLDLGLLLCSSLWWVCWYLIKTPLIYVLLCICWFSYTCAAVNG